MAVPHGGIYGSETKSAITAISGEVARRSIDHMRKRASQGHTVPLFSVGNDNEASIKANEILFTTKAFERDATSNSSAPVASSLNGMGEDSVRAFPNDPEMQMEHLMSQITVVGHASSSVEYDIREAPNESNMVTINVTGNVTVPAHRVLPLAKLVKVVPRVPAWQGEDTNSRITGTPATKATLMVVPADDEWATIDFAHTLQRNMKHFLHDPTKYEGAFHAPGSQNMRGLERIFAMKVSRQFHIYSAIMGFFSFIWRAPNDDTRRSIRDAFTNTVNPNGAVEKSKLDDLATLMKNQIGLGEPHLTPEQEMWQRDIVKTLMLPDRGLTFTEYAMGFDPRTQSNTLVAAASREPVGGNKGQILNMQLNLPTQYFAALAAMMRQHNNHVIGRVTKQAKPRGMADILLTI